jgi:hypothetical protein
VILVVNKNKASNDAGVLHVFFQLTLLHVGYSTAGGERSKTPSGLEAAPLPRSVYAALAALDSDRHERVRCMGKPAADSAMSRVKRHCGPRRAPIRPSRRLGTILATCWMSRDAPKQPLNACARRCIALLLQRKNQYAEASYHWRRYLAADCQSEWATHARRSLKFCEMQVHF